MTFRLTLYAFVRVSLEPESFVVSPGEVFSIVLSTPASVLPGGGINPYAWAGDGAGRYDRGGGYINIRGSGFQLTAMGYGIQDLCERSAGAGKPHVARGCRGFHCRNANDEISTRSLRARK